MRTTVTYPGVYIDELPPANWPTAAVSTSIAAFIGRTRWGPQNHPVSIQSFEEFERQFGGLHSNCPLTYSVYHFFENGGTEALIVRLFEPSQADDGAETGDGYATIPCGEGLVLRAASPGSMGNRLTATIDRLGITERSAAQFAQYRLNAADLFHLSVELRNEADDVIASERFLNLSVKRSGAAKNFPNSIDKALNARSELVRELEHCEDAPPDSDGLAAAGGSDGTFLTRRTFLGSAKKKTGLRALDNAPPFNLMCIPPDRGLKPSTPDAEQDLDPKIYAAAAKYCTDRRAFLIVDPPAKWSRLASEGKASEIDTESLGIFGQSEAGEEIDRNAAIYFPRLSAPDPLNHNTPSLFAPSGAIAGCIAATDAADGVWKAPAGMRAELAGASGLELAVKDADVVRLSHLGINCLRELPGTGPLIWGARTMRGTDGFEDNYQYISVRRLALFIEETIARSLKAAVFEPNEETLWAEVRTSTASFLKGLEKQGALYRFDVKCDATTTTASDLAKGVMVLIVQFSPVHPDECLTLVFEQAAAPPTTEKA